MRQGVTLLKHSVERGFYFSALSCVVILELEEQLSFFHPFLEPLFSLFLVLHELFILLLLLALLFLLILCFFLLLQCKSLYFFIPSGRSLLPQFPHLGFNLIDLLTSKSLQMAHQIRQTLFL